MLSLLVLYLLSIGLIHKCQYPTALLPTRLLCAPFSQRLQRYGLPGSETTNPSALRITSLCVCVCVLNVQWNHRLFCLFLGISLLLSHGEVFALMADEPFRAHKHKWDSGEFNGWHPRAPSPLPIDAVSWQRMPICVTNTSTWPDDKTLVLTDTLTTEP